MALVDTPRSHLGHHSPHVVDALALIEQLVVRLPVMLPDAHLQLAVDDSRDLKAEDLPDHGAIVFDPGLGTTVGEHGRERESALVWHAGRWKGVGFGRRERSLVHDPHLWLRVERLRLARNCARPGGREHMELFDVMALRPRESAAETALAALLREHPPDRPAPRHRSSRERAELQVAVAPTVAHESRDLRLQEASALVSR